MHADHTGHDRPKHKTPEYFYDTPFSLIAFMLALMMIIPIPRVMPTPEARADGANGVCEQICSGSICGISDPNDPDCAIGCACNDGTTVLIIGIPDVNTCNTSATCQNHGGWVGGGGELGGCGSLEFFNGGTVCSADVHAVDPDTGAVLVNESLFAGQQLGALERQAIDDVLTLHGLPAADKDRLLAWGRDRVRAQLFAKLVDIINKPATERTANEQVLYNWLTNIVWQKRIEPAQKAWEQYLAWNNAVEFATCSWQPPNKVVWQPKWLTATDDPQLVSCQADVNLGGQTAQRLCQINGCSPGNDGIPRTDPTPNSAGNPLNPNDDGEICFASGSLTYDACTLSRCAGTPALPGCSVAIPAHPSYEQFKGYGATLARKNFVYNPSFLSIAGNTSKAASFGIALGAAVLIAGAVTGVTAAAGGLAAFSGAVFPFAATAGTAAAFAALALFATVLIVVLAVLTAIIAGISVAEFAQIPGQLQTDVRNAASTTNTAQGKPNLATLITTDAGKQEIFLAFIETVGPEIDLSGRTAPAPENEPLWAVMDQNRTPLPTESGQLLTFTSWDDILGEAGLFGGWFVPQITQSGGATQNTLALGIEYVNSNGEQWTAWRTKCQDQTNAACTFGEAIFVHTRNGDEPPTGLSEAEFAAWFANASKEIAYKNGVGSSRIARLNRRPTATGIAVDGIQTEGQQLTFTGAASDPDNDAVNLAWNFGDGTSPVTGSPVQHAFADSGSLQVVLTPTDVFGASGTTKTQSITVANVAPTATLPTPTPVNEGFPFTLSLTNPSDPSTADTQAGFQYAFDCGSGFGSFSSSNTKSCPTVDNGAFPVAAKIKDKDGGENTYTATATVHNVAPSGALLFTTLSVPEGSSFAFSFLSFGPFDPSPVDTAAGFQFAFNCGNGFGEYSSTNGVTCSTTDNGTLSVAGRIKDKDDGVGERTGDINVTNVAPTATFTATPQIFLGESATLTFSQQSDPSSVDTAAGFTYTYDCTTNGTLNVANNRAASATCQYLTTGTFTVGGTIRDKDQGVNGYTASVTVISPQQAATNLKDQVVALNLSATRTSDLTTKIDNALQKLAQGKKDQASKQLQDFIKKVNDIVRQKLITAAQGQELIDIANRIIASIAVS
ncbi:MAG TPA: PKD domain-containing protein [Methylomirabilota bacterium]|nr:PKD domain-containing protein [Methylomirabilota bacterium]